MPNGATKSSAERKAKFMATGGRVTAASKSGEPGQRRQVQHTSGEDEPRMTQMRTTLEPRRCFSRINSPALSADPSGSLACDTSSAAFLSRLFAAVTSTASARKATNRTGAASRRTPTRNTTPPDDGTEAVTPSIPFRGRRRRLSTTIAQRPRRAARRPQVPRCMGSAAHPRTAGIGSRRIGRRPPRRGRRASAGRAPHTFASADCLRKYGSAPASSIGRRAGTGIRTRRPG